MGKIKHPSDFNYVNAKSLPFQLFRFYFRGWLIKKSAYKEFELSRLSIQLRYKSKKAQSKKIKEELKKQRSSQISKVTKRLLKMRYLDEEYRKFPSTKDKRIKNVRKCIRGNLRPFYEFAKNYGIKFSEIDKRIIENEIFENLKFRESACKYKNIFEGIMKAIDGFLHSEKVEIDKKGHYVIDVVDRVKKFESLSKTMGYLKMELSWKDELNKKE